MKHLKLFISFVLVYLVASLSAWNFNPGDWHLIVRFLVALFIVIQIDSEYDLNIF